MIPKQIFQTWSTKQLPPVLQEHVDRIRALNQGYAYHLFDDNDMDTFVNINYPGRIANAYNRLNIMVARADFWRYLVLYKHGGVYLDMDSNIHIPLDALIRDTDEAIITAEADPPNFVQWGLVMKPGHLILKYTIDLVVENIESNKYPNDILSMTGPTVFTHAVKLVCEKEEYNFEHHLMNRFADITFGEEGKSFRICGINYCGFMSWCDHDVKIEMTKNRLHWLEEQKVRPLLK